MRVLHVASEVAPFAQTGGLADVLGGLPPALASHGIAATVLSPLYRGVEARIEKLGLKTYAQAVDTADGRRVRVRLGPFANREEAERAAAKLKGAGLPGAILTL